MLEAVPAALEFLTPIRVHAGGPLPDEAVGSSSAFFPLVGLLLGLMLVAIDRLLTPVLPSDVVNALLVAFLAAASWLLHLDGLADTVDGVLGGRSPSRRL